ncbi:PREDICTED: superoxide dismutase [Cu-Zn], chloroplastic-like [Wasmannia auropunctata]|uniref:superoxide dismutase [Cu-Zn], chloroplastic-like n=1 Tax=Wasmannia auropunctata TaxID=64793 RepID=UPI0005EED839|nr:PREDICTED: superoxide dismutase [Cu-Zn], chloroplastic-like [Wasmannia auropunctata]
MSRMLVLLVVAVTVVTVTYSHKVAFVRLMPNNVSVKNVTGILKIAQRKPNGPVCITGIIRGLTEGLHGFHVHERGDLSNGCTSTGAHFNPKNVHHGAPTDNVRHVGDLGNIRADSNGRARINITDRIISLRGLYNIIGRSFVVHSGKDDLGKGNNSFSLTTGNAGERWACGVIGI